MIIVVARNNGRKKSEKAIILDLKILIDKRDIRIKYLFFIRQAMVTLYDKKSIVVLEVKSKFTKKLSK